MKYTILPSTGLQVSQICLGTMTFGGQTSAADSESIISYALDHGVNFIDTANIYTRGESEAILGRSLGSRRKDVILATKTGGPTARVPNSFGLSRRQIVSSVEDSLKRLNTDYIDLLYLHFPDKNTPAEEYIDTVSCLIRAGKVRYWGISNFSAWQCCDILHTAKQMNAIAPCITENVYSLINRSIEDELVPFLNHFPMGLAAFNPLAGGLLTGKHRKEKFTEGTRFELEHGYALRYWNDQNFEAVDFLKKIALENDMTMVELSYRWLFSQRWVTSIICGVSKLAQLQENLSYCTDEPLSADVLEKCKTAWAMIHGNYFNYHR